MITLPEVMWPLWPEPGPGRLYQGGIYALQQLNGFGVLVLCAHEWQFSTAPIGDRRAGAAQVATFQDRGGTILRCPMDDYKWPLGPEGRRQWRMVWSTAGKVAEVVQAGKRVLVTCAEGRNRSGLVNAVSLHLITGWEGEKCIQHIKARRPRALDNPWFCSKIRELK